MKKTAKVLLFIAIAVITNLSFAQTGKGIKFESDSSLVTALSKAKSEGKNIFIDCFTTWCGPCKLMVKNVFPNDSVGEFFNSHFICISIDMERQSSPELYTFEIVCYPSYIFLNKDGKLLHRSSGAYSVHDFIKLGQDAIDPKKQYATFEDRYKKGNLSTSELIQYLSLRQSACFSVENDLKKYLNTQTEADYSSRINWFVINNFGVNLESSIFQYLLTNREKFNQLYTLDSVNHIIEWVYADTMGKSLYLSIPDTVGYKELRTELIKLNVYFSDIVLDLDLQFYQIVKDWQQYAKTAVQYVERYSSNNHQGLNYYAYMFYKNINDTVYLNKALNWSKCCIDIEFNCHYMDTYASLLYKLGRKTEAVIIEEKAIELAEKEGENSAPFKEMLVKINALK